MLLGGGMSAVYMLNCVGENYATMWKRLFKIDVVSMCDLYNYVVYALRPLM